MNAREALLSMGKGRTKVLYGRVVTRWAEDAFEIGTYGVCLISVTDAAQALETGTSPLAKDLTKSPR